MYPPSIVRKDEIARCWQESPGAPSVQHQFSFLSPSLWQPAGKIHLLRLRLQLTRKITHSFSLKSFDDLNVCVHVICGRLELLQNLLCLINDGLVLQDGAVMGKIDCCWLIVILVRQSLSFGVTLAEGLQRSNGL